MEVSRLRVPRVSDYTDGDRFHRSYDPATLGITPRTVYPGATARDALLRSRQRSVVRARVPFRRDSILAGGDMGRSCSVPALCGVLVGRLHTARTISTTIKGRAFIHTLPAYDIGPR